MKTILFVVTLFSGLLSFAQSTENSVIAVVNKADWCSVCKAHGANAVGAFNSNNTDHYFEFVVNDITNNETKERSSKDLEKVGLSDVSKTSTAAGVLSFYDAKTKELLAQITVANSKEEITMVMNGLREKVTH